MPTEIITLLLKIILLAMEGQPPEVRAELWRLHLEDVKAWRAFFDKISIRLVCGHKTIPFDNVVQ